MSKSPSTNAARLVNRSVAAALAVKGEVAGPRNKRTLSEATKRIGWAKVILGQHWKPELVEGCVWAMLAHENRAFATNEIPRSKSEKRALAATASALRRLLASLRSKNLPSGIRKLLPLELLEERETILKKMDGLPLRKPKQPSSSRKKAIPSRYSLRWEAARYASLTLQQLGVKRVTTRGKTLHKLAAAYYGDKRADLYSCICRYYKVDYLDAE